MNHICHVMLIFSIAWLTSRRHVDEAWSNCQSSNEKSNSHWTSSVEYWQSDCHSNNRKLFKPGSKWSQNDCVQVSRQHHANARFAFDVHPFGRDSHNIWLTECPDSCRSRPLDSQRGVQGSQRRQLEYAVLGSSLSWRIQSGRVCSSDVLPGTLRTWAWQRSVWCHYNVQRIDGCQE